MARYMQTAAEANEFIKETVEAFRANNMDEDMIEDLCYLAAKCVNYGMRCCPRQPQGVVRKNAVERAMQDLPVKISMQKVHDEKTGREFNALSVDYVD